PALQDADLGVVADHEAVGPGLPDAARDHDVAAQQRGLHPPVEVADLRAGQQDRVLDLGALHHAVLADRRVGPDVAIGQPRDGAIARAASWMIGMNMYTPTSARSVLGTGGFSANATTRPSSSSATP